MDVDWLAIGVAEGAPQMTRRMLPLIVLIFAASALALADEAAIQGIGGAIRPMREHPSVAMERMEVNADIWPRYA